MSTTLGFQDCDTSDSVALAFINSLINPNDDECRFNPTDSTLDLDGAQDKVELYSTASAEETSLDLYNMVMDNYLNDTKPVAWMKAQVVVAEAYEDGKTREQARVDARRATADYYAIKQKNDIVWWNTTASAAEVSIEERSELEPINNPTPVTKSGFARVDSGNGWLASKTYEGPNTSFVTLVNDSPADVLACNYAIGDGYNSVNTYKTYCVVPARHGWPQINRNLGWGFCGQEVAAPNSSYDPMTFIEYQSFADHWARYETKNDSPQVEVLNFVNTTCDNFAVGNISSSDMISANTAMFEYGAQPGPDSTSLYDSTATSALMGFDVPDIQSSGLTNITDRSGMTDATHQGLALARSTPNGSWFASITYSTLTIDGPAFIATATSEKVDLDGTFTITEMTARDKSSVQSQSMIQYVYKMTNTNEFVNMTSELESLRQDIEEREQLSGSPGGSGGLGSQTPGIALLVGVTAVLLIQREGSE